MSIKRILTAAAASVVAVSAMAVVASAETFEKTVKAEDVNNSADGFFSQVQLGHIQKIDSLTIAYTAADGSKGYALYSGNWGGEAAQDANGITMDGGNFENWTGANVTLPEGVDPAGLTFTVTAVVEDYAGQVEQFTTKYPENTDGTDMMIFTFGGSAEGKVIAKGGDLGAAATPDEKPEEKPEETKPEEKPEESKTEDTTTKPNVDTGVEGVAAVVGVAAVAFGAMVVAKKRK